MNSEIAIVGNLDAILIFKSVGCDVFEVRDKNSTIQTVTELISKYKIIFITDDFAPFIEKLIEETKNEMFPIITIIPSGTNDSNYALSQIEKSVEHTLGINILSQKEHN